MMSQPHEIADWLIDHMGRIVGTDGKVIAEYVLDEDTSLEAEEWIESLQGEEQTWAVESVFAVAGGVESAGWPESARWIREICEVAGSLYQQTLGLVAEARAERTRSQRRKLGFGGPVLRAREPKQPAPAGSQPAWLARYTL